MALFFITGIAGSGKSTVCQELKARGYQAYDTDEDALSKWQNNETGYVHPKSSVKKEQRTEAFLRAHSWNIPRPEVEALSRQARDKTIFICGVADNLASLLDLIETVFALSIDSNTLQQRIEARTNNDMGKRPEELQFMLEDHERKEAFYKRAGFVMLDAKQPTKAIVDRIIQEVKLLSHNQLQ